MESSPLNTGSWNIYITWLLVVFGWFIVSWQNNRREERKEVRGYLDDIVSNIEGLVKESVLYHTGKRREVELENNILYGLERLSEKIQYLKFVPSEYISHYNDLKVSITVNNFQTWDFKSRKIDDPLIETIRDEAHFLIQNLELQFLVAFRGSLGDRIKFQIQLYKESNSYLTLPRWFIEGTAKVIMIAGAYFIIIALLLRIIYIFNEYN